jgi:hypothetical protein
VEKISEDDQKVGKISQVISQTHALGQEHDKIWAQWASSIPREHAKAGMMM